MTCDTGWIPYRGMDRTELKTGLCQIIFSVNVWIEASNRWTFLAERAIVYADIIDINGVLNHKIKE
jgi:hypothetical protein